MTEPGAGPSLRRSSDGVWFWIHVTPRARREQVGGLHGDALRVAVREPPVEGAANAACVRALARMLGVRRDAVVIDPGSRGRRKRVHVRWPAGAGDAERRNAIERALKQLAAG